MDKRLYYVTFKDDPKKLGRLVEGTHPAQAFRHVGQDLLEVSLPTALEAAALVKQGVEVEDPSAKPELPSEQF
jgi:hypothetical protein